MEIYLVGFIAVIAAVLLFKSSRIKVQDRSAILVFGLSSPRVLFSSGFYIPILEKYKVIDIKLKTVEISCRGQQAISCKDYIRANIVCCFYYHILEDKHSILSLFDENNGYSPIDKKDIYQSAFEKQLTKAAAEFDFLDLFMDRITIRNIIQDSLNSQFAEIEIVDIAIDYLEQLPLSEMNPEDELDRKGIEKIELIIAQQNEQKN